MHEEQATGAGSRRAFLGAAAGTALGAGIATLAGGAAGADTGPPAVAARVLHPPPGPQATPHRHYQRGRFEDAPGGRVSIRVDGEVHRLDIAEVEALGVADGAPSGSRLWHNAFRVTLTGPKGVRIPQGTHPVSIGGRNFDLFVVPVMSRRAAPVYEAIINRAYRRASNG